MLSKVLLATAAIALVMPQIAISQNVPSGDSDIYTRPESAYPPPDNAAAGAPSNMPESRLLAAVRAYPPGVLQALFAVSQQPALLRQLAQDPQKLMNPQSINPPVSAELQRAIRQLQQTPEIVAVAAGFPDEVESLRQLYQSAPQQVEQRLADLRARYDAARLQGAQAWEQMLAQNPAALDQYRDLVTQFTRDQLKQYREFPYVDVKQPQYYFAAPPNELIMAYVQDRKPGAPLDSILSNWWSQHGPDQVDARVASQSAPLAAGQSLAALPPQQRAEMWQSPTDRTGSEAALLPIIMQPMPDQPPDARAAYAVAENARLWSGPETDQLTQEPPMAGAPQAGPQQGAVPQYARRQGAAPQNATPRGAAPQRARPQGPAPQYAPPDSDQPAAPDQPPTYVEQGPDYEYEYTPAYEAPPQVVYTAPAVYYSPLVPYYYGYPAVWPVAYAYYPGLYSYWPYYWYGPGACFSFNFGYGPHYFHCGFGYWGHGYWGHWGYWGHGGWGHPYAHYYGHGEHGGPYGYGHGFDHGGYYGHSGDGHGGGHYDRDRISGGHGGRSGGGDRFAGGRGGKSGADSFGSVRGGHPSGGDSLGTGRGGAGHQYGERSGGREARVRSPQGSQGFHQGGGRSFEGGQSFHQGGGDRSLRSQSSGADRSVRGQGFNGSSSMGSIRHAPRMGGASAMSHGFQSAPGHTGGGQPMSMMGSGGGHSMGTIRSGGGFGGGGFPGGVGGFHGGGGHR